MVDAGGGCGSSMDSFLLYTNGEPLNLIGVDSLGIACSSECSRDICIGAVDRMGSLGVISRVGNRFSSSRLVGLREFPNYPDEGTSKKD